jgi:hypothetical protein
MLLFIAPIVVAALLSFVSEGLGMIALAVGIIAGCVFMIIFGVKWSVFAPACVIERTGPLACLSRSSDLTGGYRAKIFGIFLLIGIVVFIISAVAQFLTNAIFGTGLLVDFFSALVRTIPLTYFNVVPAVIYYGLRTVKENLTPASLADIFD